MLLKIVHRRRSDDAQEQRHCGHLCRIRRPRQPTQDRRECGSEDGDKKTLSDDDHL
jgi:hypothetical protein